MQLGKLHRIASAFGLFAFVFLFGFLEWSKPAEAQSRAQICRGLNKQLASLGNSRATGGNSAKYRQYDSAARKQSNQITKAKRALRRNGCIGLFKNSKSQCRAINKSLKKMQANLSALKKQRARYAPKQANNSAKRNRIMASLRRNRCGRPGQEDTRIASNDQQPKSRRRTLLEQVFGVRAYDNAGNRRYDEIIGGDENLASRFGTFRTLCVRKTDGYYFPISFSTVSERFEEDALTCQSMCPGTDVGLYHHRMPHEDSEDMVSYATNTAYRDEPFAFAYRQIHNPDNRCRFSTAGITQNVDTTPLDEVEGTNKEVRIGTPVFRKDQTLSPDAFDTAVEGLTANAIENYFASVRDKKTGSSDDVLANNRKVRIVGPAFFPVQ